MCLLSSSDRCLVGWWAGDSRILRRAYGGRHGEAPPATTSEPIASFVEWVASAAKSKAGHGPSEAGGSGRYPDQVMSVGITRAGCSIGPPCSLDLAISMGSQSHRTFAQFLAQFW